DYLLDDDINGDPSNPLNKPMHFGSFQKQRQPNSFRRLPICFPDIKLTLMKLEEHQLEQIKQTGWLREAAFKTTPNTTKLEIKAFLESVYGMEVERVNTANYLGRKRVVYTGKAKELYREDDYKKAYVIFKKPEGLSLPETRPLLQKLVDIKLKRK
uniref:uL23m n=1 Tax=Polytomella magna TaxID=353565 RepID=UPI002240E3B6|nr:Chain Ar, uL23m [Polytomella magna]8APN_Ar Chain Ar, uL23m [Polytomella magna]8APO_Ar Chain Ar, uL23m [Polytomella magna]